MVNYFVEQVEQWKNLLCTDQETRNRYQELLKKCNNEPMFTLMELRKELIDSGKRGNIPLKIFIEAYNLGDTVFMDMCQEYFLEPLFPMTTDISETSKEVIVKTRKYILEKVDKLISKYGIEKVLSDIHTGRTDSFKSGNLHSRILRVLSYMD